MNILFVWCIEYTIQLIKQLRYAFIGSEDVLKRGARVLSGGRVLWNVFPKNMTSMNIVWSSTAPGRTNGILNLLLVHLVAREIVPPLGHSKYPNTTCTRTLSWKQRLKYLIKCDRFRKRKDFLLETSWSKQHRESRMYLEHTSIQQCKHAAIQLYGSSGIHSKTAREIVSDYYGYIADKEESNLFEERFKRNSIIIEWELYYFCADRVVLCSEVGTAVKARTHHFDRALHMKKMYSLYQTVRSQCKWLRY